ncbi:minc metabolism membrane protein [Sorochytrium milnesiophthora]
MAPPEYMRRPSLASSAQQLPSHNHRRSLSTVSATSVSTTPVHDSANQTATTDLSAPGEKGPKLAARLAAVRQRTRFGKRRTLRSAFKRALFALSSPLKLYKYHEIPEHLQDNEFIYGHYRAHYSYADCAKSMVHMHNETFNIWTHLIGSFVFVGLLIKIFSSALEFPPSATTADKVVVGIYHLTAVICLFCSGVFHTFHCHSRLRVFDQMAILDYTGIAMLLFGSFLSLIYFALKPYPHILPIPLAITSVSSLGGMVLPWFSFFRSYKKRLLRLIIFLGLAASIVASFFWAMYEVWPEVRANWQWSWLNLTIGIAVSYIGGAVIYGTRFPECLFPGRFDLIGHSHQIWHVFVIAGALCNHALLKVIVDWRLSPAGAGHLQSL